MPRLIRFAIINFTIGTLLCWAVLGTLVALNFNGWLELLAASRQPWLGGLVVALSVGPFFGVCYFATGLMLISESDEE